MSDEASPEQEATLRVLRRLDHAFADPGLAERALTHRSAAGEHNERLEFLGDAVLNFLIAEALFRRFPDLREGRLTRLRASLVRRETLAEIARELDLGRALRLGGGELKTGGRDRDSILSDALEALLGAVYLDGGLAVCRERVAALFAERLDRLGEAKGEKDPKTHLQELLQARHQPLPEYVVLATQGSAHARLFTVECRIAVLDAPTRGRGTSRRIAEQEAARRALARIGDG